MFFGTKAVASPTSNHSSAKTLASNDNQEILMFKKVTLALALIGAAGVPAVAGAQAIEQKADAIAVVRDPHSGKLRAPTADEQKALNNGNGNGNGSSIAVRAAAVPTQQKFHSTGARGLRLNDEFMSSSVVTRTADGKIEMQCLEPGHKGMAPHTAHASLQPVTE
jgi:hypothetical protein